MTPELTATLAPLLAAVERAQAALDAHNRAEDANPLDGIHLAGYVIAAQAALIVRLLDLLDAVGTGDTHETRMRVHGRLRALSEKDEPR